MLNVFRQKRELGLVRFGEKGNEHEIEDLTNDVEFIFILAGHKQSHTRLKEIVDNLVPMKNAEILFATASFMGYSLYSENMLTMAQFSQLLKDK